MKKLLLVGLVLMLLVSIVVLGCSKKEEEPAAPEIPPSGIFDMDLSLFGEATAAMERSVLDVEHCEDFDTAAAIVIVWTTLTQITFLIPRLAFAFAIAQDPTYEGDLTWRWTLGNIEGNNTSLYAQLISDSVQWDMKVTNDSLTDFLWYTGRCNTAATGGWWQFNFADSTHSETPALWVGWERSSDADTNASLTIANIVPESEDNGDTLGYSIDGTIATVWINNIAGEKAGRWNIVWDREEHWGSIEYPEGNRGCWDDSLECVDCDSIPVF